MTKSPAAKIPRGSNRSKTVPEMFKRQSFKNTATQESSDEDDELESSEEESEDSDTEQKKKSVRRRTKGKKTATRVDLDQNSQLLEEITEESVSTEDIFANIVSEEDSIEDIVKRWVKKYQKNSKVEALKDLINFIIRSSGCLIAVTTEALVKDDGAIEALQELQEKLVALPSTDYPVATRVKEHKPFKKHLLMFFSELIEQCQGGIIYDGALVETLQSWLTTMSSSLYRPFRHTATIIALRIMTSLCIVADRTRVEITNNTRQSNSAKKSNQASKQKVLKANAASLGRKRKSLNVFLTEYFENIFVHRSHDVESVIRAECIKEMCQFVQNYQSRFVENHYLRHLGWAFNDQHASVRSEAIKSITRLYKMEDIINKLDYFTERFTERLEEMALYDVDVSVRVNTVALLSYLFQKKKATLSDQGRMHLGRLIVSDVPRVRNAAAPFVKTVIESEVIRPLVTDAQASLAEAARGGRRATRQQEDEEVPVNTAWVTFKGFAAFLVKQIADNVQQTDDQSKTKKKKNDDDMMDEESDDDMDEDNQDDEENEAALINATASKELAEKRNLIVTKTVEALWTQMKELQDYDAMSEYLCRDHSQTNDEDTMGNAEIEPCYRLTNQEETVLVNVYVVCLKMAVQRGLETQLVGIKDRRKIDPAILEETKNEISRHLVPTLPKLITKHSDDINKLVHLVHVPTIMNLNVYMVLQQEREYEALVQSLVKIYLGATVDALLLNCSQSMAHMCSVSYLESINDVEFVQLQEAVVKQVRDACAGMDLMTARFSSDTIHSISVSIARLDYLVSFSDATSSMDDAHGTTTNTIEYIGLLVDRASNGYKQEMEISKSSLSILSRYFLWKCHALERTTDDLVSLIERRRDWVTDKFVDLATAVDASPLDEIRVLALGYLVDVYWVLSSDLFDNNGLQRLKVSCSTDIQKTCAEYMKDAIDAWKNRVISEEEAQEELAKAVEEENAPAPKPTTKTSKEKEKEKQKERQKKREDAEKKLHALIKENKELNKLFYQTLVTYARGITVGVFNMEHAHILLDLYGPTNNDSTIEGVVRALIAEFQLDVAGNVPNCEEVCRAYLASLKTSFEEHVGESNRSMEPTLKLARLQATSFKAPAAETEPVPPPQVITERIHVDGISYVFEKVSDAIERSDHDERVNALKFFKVLATFGKALTRARDIAKIHNHLEDCIQQYNIDVQENEPEFGYYMSYIKTIDEVLKKKGLRYEPTMRANNAETPAAHVFENTEMTDIPENPTHSDDDEEEAGVKRTRSSTDMDIDDKFVTKRRR